MSDRTPSTDALETLGMIHFKPEHRDAIHLAVEPVEAACNFEKAARIGIVNGVAYPAGYQGNIDGVNTTVPYHGIVDPFLPGTVFAGQKFWFVMAPRMVCSLRHVWNHPAFPEA